MKDFHALKAWRKARQLTLAVYQLTSSFPRDELYGLLARDLKMIPGDYERVRTHLSEVKRMLAGFLPKLRAES